MSEAIKPTPGPWEFDQYGSLVHGRDRITLTGAALTTGSGDRSEASANTRLLYEAGNVFADTGLTPRQLVERVKELEEAARPFANYACSPPGHCDCHNCKARDLLSKALPNADAKEAAR